MLYCIIQKNWTQCCEEACNTCKLLTTSYTPRTIQNWWQEFRQSDCFPHSRGFEASIKKAKDRIPPFLHDNEDMQQKFIRHCTNNLSDLPIDLAKEYVTDVLIPSAYPLTSDFSADDRAAMLLQRYGLSVTPVRSTIWEWLTRCGFTYKPRTKRFFVDSHESKASRKYRKEQCARYLRRERLMHRWYQFTAEEVNSLVNKELLLPDQGYRYKMEEGEKMVEMFINEIDNEEILTKIY
jgi:hypothetical protein